MNPNDPGVDRERSALPLVGIQPDFLPGGALPTHDGLSILEPVGRLLAARPFGLSVASRNGIPANRSGVVILESTPFLAEGRGSWDVSGLPSKRNRASTRSESRLNLLHSASHRAGFPFRGSDVRGSRNRILCNHLHCVR